MPTQIQEKLFEKNLAILEFIEPEFSESLLALHHTEGKFLLEEAKDKSLNLKMNEFPPQYYYSQHEPHKGVRAFFDHFSLEEGACPVFFGMGLGYHIQEFHRRYPKKYDFIIIEPDWNFIGFLAKSFDLSFLLHLQKAHLLFGNDILKCEKKIRQLPYASFQVIDTTLSFKKNQTYFKRFENFITVQNAVSKMKRRFLKQDFHRIFAEEGESNITKLRAFILDKRGQKEFSFESLSFLEKNLILLFQTIASQDFGFHSDE